MRSVLSLPKLMRASVGLHTHTMTYLDNFQNAITVNMMNHLGFTVNVSANNLEHADKLCDLDIAPVATVLPIEWERRKVVVKKRRAKQYGLKHYKIIVKGLLIYTTPKGKKVAVCPATYKDDVSCASCMLCEKWDRNVVVGFPAHGTSKKKAAMVAAG